MEGRAHRVGDHINTDYIISGKYKFNTLDMKELSKHLLEDLDPCFYEKVDEGDFLVAGANFGCGSSREQAPLVIKHAGIQAVLAQSFARIFFRNAINTGLLAIECDTASIETGDEISIHVKEKEIINKSKGTRIEIQSLPTIMLSILEDGGLSRHIKKHGDFKLEG